MKKFSGKELLKIAEKNGINVDGIKDDQLEIGFNIELEHGISKGDLDTNVTNDNVLDTIKIAIQHLREKDNYYFLLKKYVEEVQVKRFKKLIK